MTRRQRLAARVLDGVTLSRKILDRELADMLRGARARTVLDVGGASGLRYRPLLRAERYWTIDIQPTHGPSLVGDAHALPVRDGQVDLVLSIQVLEHCVNPAAAVREAYRVLAPGGRLVLSTVLLYELHGSPQDYYRFTESALRDLAAEFAHVDVRPLGNRFVAVYDLTCARSVLVNSVLGRLAFRLASGASTGCPCGFVLNAVKGR